MHGDIKHVRCMLYSLYAHVYSPSVDQFVSGTTSVSVTDERRRRRPSVSAHRRRLLRFNQQPCGISAQIFFRKINDPLFAHLTVITNI